MKVTDVKAFVVDCFRTNRVLVKDYKDEGVTDGGNMIQLYPVLSEE